MKKKPAPATKPKPATKTPAKAKPRAAVPAPKAPAKPVKATTKAKPGKAVPAPVAIKLGKGAKPPEKTIKKTAQPKDSERKQLSKSEQSKTIKPDKPLTTTETRFIDEYMKDPNGTKAYMLAKPGATEASAAVSATRMLRNAKVKAEIDKRRDVRAERLQIDGDRLVSEVNAIALADTRELVEFHVTCCRYCFGKDYGYQRTKWELNRDRDAHKEKESERELICTAKGVLYVSRAFNEMGGIGYDGRKPPNNDCPSCWGRGVGATIIKDTRGLSAGAVALYAGVKEGKDGVELLKHDKKSALDMMWRHQGLYKADNEQIKPDSMPAEMVAATMLALKKAQDVRAPQIEERRALGFTGD